MSLNTLLSALIGFGLFFVAILFQTSDIMLFVDTGSVILVLGGTLAATFMSYEPRYTLIALANIGRILLRSRYNRTALPIETQRIIEWGKVAQTRGIPAFEAEAMAAKDVDEFTRFGVQLIASGHNGADVKEILQNHIESQHEREMVPVDILKSMGAGSPAFGMIGTLVGLIIMLQNLEGDAAALGPAMALALVTTLYGVLFARMIFLPAAAKTQQRAEILRHRNYLIAEGLGLLADRKSPRYIQDWMNSYLDPSIHFDLDGAGAKKPGGAKK